VNGPALAALDRTQPLRHELCQTLIWRFGFEGRGCKVGVLDTGVDVDWVREHCPTFGNGTIEAHDCTPGHEGPVDESPEHHGSRVIADVFQLAPQAEVHSLRVYGREHNATREELVAALEWCARAGMHVVNLSTSFYGDDCTFENPCVLCRAINTFTLGAGVFHVIVGGDAYTLNELAAKTGSAPVLCPALNSPLAWAVESADVVGDRKRVLEQSLKSGGGLSFTTAKFSGGAALLRSLGQDALSTHMVLRRTCIPLPAPQRALGLGRHCFLLAFLCLQGLSAGFVEDAPPVPIASLDAPSPQKKGGYDGGISAALAWTVARHVFRNEWDDAVKMTDAVASVAAPWAEGQDLALIEHVRASCMEGVGDARAEASYARATSLMGFAPATGTPPQPDAAGT